MTKPRSDSPASEKAFVGRASEMTAASKVLDDVKGGRPALIVISGPAGIGKSSFATELCARSNGFRVITAYGDQSEKLLDFGIVDQLLRKLVNGYVRSVKSQAPLAVGTGLLDLIGEYPAEALLLLVEDVHWADKSSLQALYFVFRRLQADRVALVVTVRDEEIEALPRAFARLIDSAQATRITLSGLSPAEVGELAERMQLHLSIRALDRLHGWTAGNPLHVTAMLSELGPDRLGTDVDVPLPAPRSVADVVISRLEKCAPATREMLEAASVLGVRCDLDQLLQMTEIRKPLAAVDLAIKSGLVSSVGAGATTEITFAHPLMAAAVYHSIPLARRSDMHRRAARRAPEEAVALRHEVLARTGPDAELAARLETFSREAAANGSWSVAAEALEEASGLTADSSQRQLRLLNAIDCRLTTGEIKVSSIIDEVTRLPESAPREYILGRISWSTGNSSAAVEKLMRAWQLLNSGPDPTFAPRVAGWLGAMMMNSGRASAAVEWTRLALDALPRGAVGGYAMFSYLGALAMRGDGEAAIKEVRHLPLDQMHATPRQLEELLGRGVAHLWSGDAAGAELDLERSVSLARERAEPSLLILALCFLSDTQFRLGQWDAALTNSELGVSVAEDADIEYVLAQAHSLASYVPAARGQTEVAERHVEAAETIAGIVRDGGSVAYTAVARARLELLRNRPQAAAAALGPFMSMTAESANNPAIHPWRLMFAEVAGQLGQLDEAERFAIEGEREVREGRYLSEMAFLGRVRAAILARKGDLKGAAQVGQAAMYESTPAQAPYDFACLELEVGGVLRRLGRRREAKEMLESSRKTLFQLGAAPALARCDAELDGTGLKPVHRTPDSRHLLTPQELAVARLAADGLTNKQIAAHLVISPRTVDYHLVHVFAKLEVESRTQLSRRFPRVISETVEA